MVSLKKAEMAGIDRNQRGRPDTYLIYYAFISIVKQIKLIEYTNNEPNLAPLFMHMKFLLPVFYYLCAMHFQFYTHSSSQSNFFAAGCKIMKH